MLQGLDEMFVNTEEEGKWESEEYDSDGVDFNEGFQGKVNEGGHNSDSKSKANIGHLQDC